MKIYTVSKVKQAGLWRDLRAAGADVVSTWIDDAGPGESFDRAALWHRCVTAVWIAARS